MTTEALESFTADWIGSWNAHDLEAILDHYADDVVFTSPFVPLLAGVPDGTLRGKQQLRDYFARCFERAPELHFSDCRMFAGPEGVTLVYRSVHNYEAAETMLLDKVGRVTRTVAHYLPAPAIPAG
jgi:ketosteroid isomerase-like protein